MKESRCLMVTSALPYANGALHLGHLVEHIQTDIWVRTQRMLGHTCISVCGDDAHGTPIMLKAEQLGMTPEALTEAMKADHEADLNAYGVHYDQYHTTHSEENRMLASEIYQTLKARGDIITKTIRQAFDPVKSIFLPDRYVKGTCPRCGASDQYGDHCEACGATYAPTELIEPVSALSGVTPIEKESEHYFFNLPAYTSFLKSWTTSGALQTEVAHKLEEWFSEGLMPWDISRDAPYFGFKIPETEHKYFYVWLDAPIGYMASAQKYCMTRGLSFDALWGQDSTAELYHFVGKDIVYFHALFWPAMLKGSGYRLPTAIFTHGFLTINGQKMSKSRGTFIQAKTFRAHVPPECLRYYFAAKLNGRVEDIDLNFEDFKHRINADLVGKIINIASRLASFIHRYFEGRLAATLSEPVWFEEVVTLKTDIIQAYLERDYAKAIRMIMDASATVNQYVDQKKPWMLIKDETAWADVHAVCTMGLNMFRLLIGFLKPVLPELAYHVETFLACPSPLTWDNLDAPVLDHMILPFKPLMVRIEQAQLDAMLSSGVSA